MTGIVQEQNLEKQIEKQMGCMAGFLQIFDRHQILTGKRLYATKRLPPSTMVDSSTESEKSMPSPVPEKQHQSMPMPSPDHMKQQNSPVAELRTSVLESQAKVPLPLPVFEIKEGTKSPWKFCKEAPRLSLDSRATFDAKGSLKPKEIRTNAAILSANRCEKDGEETDDSDKQRRSPSVIARLMGLEQLPEWEAEQEKKPELRRSASESRASRDLLQYRFIDGVNFQLKQSQQQNNGTVSSNMIRDCSVKDHTRNGRPADPKEYNAVRNCRGETARSAHRGLGPRKSFFDSADFFPEPKHTVSIYGEIEKRLKMRGIDEPSKDLETLKQILEALQLKGLLHSKKPSNQTNQRTLVHDRSFSHDESPIVVMKPARSTPPPMNRPGRVGNDSSPSSYRSKPAVRRDSILGSDAFSSMSPRRERPEIERNARNQNRGRGSISPTQSESSMKSPNGRRQLTVETQRRVCNNATEQRRVSPVQSPKVSSRRTLPDQATNRSSRNRKQIVDIYQKEDKVFVPVEDESSSMSESSISASDTERLKMEDYKESRSLLERCGKLINSISEMTTTELQPSPVSVLDSSFYKEESSPSPVMKRSVDFKDQFAELEDDVWSPAISPIQLKSEENSDDSDFIYVSDILRASNYLPEDSDVFLLLEKQQYLKGKDTSKVSTLQRKLIFDTIAEILKRHGQLPPWKKACSSINTSLQQIWSEFQKIRERERGSSDDLLEVICSLLKKDLAGDSISGWGDCPIEMSEAVLDVERLIFKDLIGETIRDLAAFSGKCKLQAASLPRRKLVF